MSYIDRNLLADERVLFRTKKHKIIFLFPAVWLFFCFYATYYMQSNVILVHVVWAPWFMALLFWGYVGLEFYTSEFAVTNKRIMMREGFFNRHANEMRLTAISQVNVDQTIFGQMLNYGTVSINAFGAFDNYPMIDQPGKFQRAVNEQLDLALSGK